ncbi:YdhR family protein [Pseudorhodoferax sp. Leaf265]|uniref:YdhR family protein n=1 Tax=Pseudorhodoferax sp. Leaf265 TaxID=1736315 RepID=UPI0006F3F510|nr:YdhR family protein [Pseudorhodoferax sp. Leaf265]KQP18779.1 hypothetical protein ASF45_26535 [Pseudorhodoferax sp. Leaf265]
MIVVQSSFPLPSDTTWDAFTTAMAETVPHYRSVPGLLRKLYIYDADRQEGGGIYSFDSRQSAQDCFNAEMVARATSRFGRFELQWFECPIAIDNEAGSVFGAPRS